MLTQAILAVSLTAAMTCAAADARMPERTVRLSVPKQLDAPVLKLDGFEHVTGERVTIEVLGPPEGKSKARPVLAVSGLVGSGAKGEVETMDLVIPLNERAARVLANRSEVTLTLRLRRGRHPLRWKRAYLTSM